MSLESELSWVRARVERSVTPTMHRLYTSRPPHHPHLSCSSSATLIKQNQKPPSTNRSDGKPIAALGYFSKAGWIGSGSVTKLERLRLVLQGEREEENTRHGL